MHEVVDLFAGPGGWDEGLRMIHPDLHAASVGLELDYDACSTARAAGHLRHQVDIAAAEPPGPYAGARGMIASPPCQAWSTSGLRSGQKDRDLVMGVLHGLLHKPNIGDHYRGVCADPRSMLVIEPLRWAMWIDPDWIALEQVEPVLPVWKAMAAILGMVGYYTWTGVLSSERYGVPQVRRRAFLLASRDHPVGEPSATHRRFDPRGRRVSNEEHHLPEPPTMAEALGWDEGRLVGLPRKDDGRKDGSVEIDGVLHRKRDLRSSDAPAHTVTTKAGWWLSRPSTTIMCRDEVARPGHKSREHPQMEDAVRLTPEEAGILQGFPRDYPWHGNKTKVFEQIGNAVPPPVAAAVLAEVIG